MTSNQRRWKVSQGQRTRESEQRKHHEQDLPSGEGGEGYRKIIGGSEQLQLLRETRSSILSCQRSRGGWEGWGRTELGLLPFGGRVGFGFFVFGGGGGAALVEGGGPREGGGAEVGGRGWSLLGFEDEEGSPAGGREEGGEREGGFTGRFAGGAGDMSGGASQSLDGAAFQSFEGGGALQSSDGAATPQSSVEAGAFQSSTGGGASQSSTEGAGSEEGVTPHPLSVGVL